jgi:hypothetical protein
MKGDLRMTRAAVIYRKLESSWVALYEERAFSSGVKNGEQK